MYCPQLGAAPFIVRSMDRLFTPWRYAYIAAKDEGMLKKGVPEILAGWSGDHGCVFCNMLAAVDYAIKYDMDRDEAEESIGLLERGKTGFLVLNSFPYSSGHLMAVPYQHEASLAALPMETAVELMSMMRRAERALRKVYQPEGLNMGLNLGESAGAGVAHHLHIHALPRWSGDTNFMTVVAETRILPEILADSWRKLRAALAAEPAE
jgi:ATP adenylyltransferase